MSFVIPEYKSNLMVLGVKLDEPIVEPSPSPDYPWYGEPGYIEPGYIEFTLNSGSDGIFQFGDRIESITSIDWGDGSNTVELSHTYSEKDTEFTVKAIVVMKSGDYRLVNVNYAPKLLYVDKLNLDSNVTYIGSMFFECSSITTVPLFDTSKVTNMSGMFSGCSSLTTVPLFDTGNVTDMGGMLAYCSSLTTVPLFDTISVTYMSSMFYKCSSLTTVPLFDTRNVTDMYDMFDYCTSLTTVPLFNTSKVTNMGYMFIGCSSLTTVPLFDTGNVTDVSYMLYYCIDLSTFPEFRVKSSCLVENALYGTQFAGRESELYE